MKIKSLALVILISLGAFGSVIAFNEYKKIKISEYMSNIPEASMPVVSKKISLENYLPKIEVIGFITPEKGVEIGNEISGIVRSINFKSGDFVEKGDSLIELDTAIEDAQLYSAQARLPAVKNKYNSDLKLFKNKTIPKITLDESEAAYYSLLAEIEGLKSRINLKKINAPFSGQTGINHIQIGQFLNAGEDIVRLENLENMKVLVSVPQKYYNSITKDQIVSIKVEAQKDKSFEGKVLAKEPIVDQNTGLFEVEIFIPNNERLLRAGMFSKVSINQEELKDQIVIPQTAIQYALYGESVYVIQKDENGKERANQVFVKTGERFEDQVIIEDGLKEGDIIVTNGQLKLSNGVLVHESEDKTLENIKIENSL